MVTRKQIRRWASEKAMRLRLRKLARRLDPGPRTRLWTSDWKAIADTDRGDVIVGSGGGGATVNLIGSDGSAWIIGRGGDGGIPPGDAPTPVRC
ncbi:hypothetical protein [Nocardia wallacei]|uniref:hypothetical protein n=1 Tax=Nocardia wallacei TaxID=480035 RepID=UPI002454FE62|nr:hypothetical protein [Nocardia wallacei]